VEETETEDEEVALIAEESEEEPANRYANVSTKPNKRELKDFKVLEGSTSDVHATATESAHSTSKSQSVASSKQNTH
jgi:hypothetical protein